MKYKSSHTRHITLFQMWNMEQN